jgi:molybdate transport system substrate-binding protein
VAAFRQALLDARAVAYIDPAAGGSSGVYLSQLFVKMGIAPQMQAKAVLVPGGLVAQRVVDVARPTWRCTRSARSWRCRAPRWSARFRPRCRTTPCTRARSAPRRAMRQAAQDFLTLLGSAEARAVLAQKGMEAP